ncbi:MAG: DMT family transporter [Oscillospiraceae bacterium]
MEHQRRADLMLLLTTSFWGISNCLTAICLRDMQPLTLNAFRFVIAFLVLGFVFHKNLRRVSRVTVKYSIMVGLSLVIVYTSLTYGVLYTSVSNAGFIGALSVVTTPILEFIVYHKKPEKKFGVSMLLCLVGLALMTERNAQARVRRYHLPVRSGVYSVDLMVTERPWRMKRSTRWRSACDLAVVGVVMLMLSVFLETPALPGTAKVWAAALFLGIVCSGVCLVIQSVYQKHTTASRASLIFTLEPVFSAIFAFFLLGERIGVKGYIGAALMLASLVLVEVDVGALFGKNKKKAD